MFISRKKFEEELEKAKREMYSKMEEERKYDHIHERINRLSERVFDIETRLHEITCNGNEAKKEFEAAMNMKGEI